MSLIKFKNVSKQYNNRKGVDVISDLNLEIKKGEFVFLTGPSGSGKSTIIKMLYREEKPTKGEVILGGVIISKIRDSKVYWIRRKMGVIFQDFKLLPKLTVYENVAYALEVLGEKKSEIRKKVLKALEQVDLKDKAKFYPEQLSGGEQQRVSIARAIVNEPKLLLCDEPTGNLDPKASWELMEILEKINKKGTTIIMATHDREIVNKMKKRVITLESGRIVADVKEGEYVYEINN
ncbi:MAG TPA: cell division ATP-binding protein FtsE [Tenericutes bacterium]|jgi:cell division transport system ATP-binding protein|nr:cell division ATP-binding protein FtsE [Mycoplasmatota bacterium]